MASSFSFTGVFAPRAGVVVASLPRLGVVGFFAPPADFLLSRASYNGELTSAAAAEEAFFAIDIQVYRASVYCKSALRLLSKPSHFKACSATQVREG